MDIHKKKQNEIDVLLIYSCEIQIHNGKKAAEKDKEKKRDALLANEASKAFAWLLEVVCMPSDKEEEKEVFPGLGLTWRVVGKGLEAANRALDALSLGGAEWKLAW